ncbi:glycosyltransferase [Subtercola endophyticus]|uniref:glycosyltransferase n=1 Tax=Subtercola endophyticus TaxID=2895559 RepID=UPI001E3C5EE3|nr:hypothetical protein [Subtercola endophyticus]UFS60862.1 hypothetical protein LQ955_09060 [Subtercola endophyticus]
MTSFGACTIIARNYLAQARVLSASFASLNPGVPLYTLVVDGDEADRSLLGIGEVVLPADLGLDSRTLHSMMTIYDVMEFSTSLKPALLMHLIRRGHKAVAYFDPDIQLFASVADVLHDAEAGGIVLTPHVLTPFPRDGKIVSEQMVMTAGIYNLGFIAVGASAFRFLAWWNDRLRFDAISDPANALFTDQRFIDWVPSLFACTISRDRGLNVAHWNLHERPLGGVAGALTAGGFPLRFLHFSGYDPRLPWLLSKHTQENPRVLLSEHPLLRTLCDEYGDALIAAGYLEQRDVAYRFDTLPNGVRLTSSIRRLVRSVERGDIEPLTPPPDAFEHPDAFASWLLRPAFGDRLATLTAIEFAVWSGRSDLRSAFSDVLVSTGQAYKDWFAHDPSAQQAKAAVESRLAPVEQIDDGSRAPQRSSLGWAVVVATVPGTDEHEIAVRLANSVLLTPGPFSVIGLHTAPDRAAQAPGIRLVEQIDRDNMIVLLAADQAVNSEISLALDHGHGRSIAVVLGDAPAVSDSPASRAAFGELWVTSRAAAERLAAETRAGTAVQTVRQVSFPLESTRSAGAVSTSEWMLDRAEGDLIVLCDAGRPGRSTVDDLLLTLEVFRAANDAVAWPSRLVVLTAQLPVADRERLAFAVGTDRRDVILVSSQVTPAEKGVLARAADIVISLHSEQPLGLVVADAMAAATPVVASGGSAQLWATDSSTASLVPLDADGRADFAHSVRALSALLRASSARDRQSRAAASALHDFSAEATAARLGLLLTATGAMQPEASAESEQGA